ncbi:MAG: hypothetical protein V7603_3413 [Micromonosporaceae bacterium]
MDLLARLAAPAQDLLERVDRALLTGGAPAGHPIWPLLRRLGALPGELVIELAATTPESLRAAADPLRELARAYVDGLDLMPGAAGWRGDAAEAFGAQWRALAAHLADGADSMAGGLTGTASYVDDVAGWLAATRDAVAVALARCLGSTEAATLRALPAGALGSGVAGLAGGWLATGAPGAMAGPRSAILAAAGIGAHLLRAAADGLDHGEALHSRWAGRLDELPYRPTPAPAPPADTHLALPS